MIAPVAAVEFQTSLAQFVTFARSLKGDETALRGAHFPITGGISQVVAERDDNSEVQLFLDKFFRALGHGGVQETGATLEFRIAKSPAPHNSNSSKTRPPDFVA